MSYEPDSSDRAIRELKEEIARIREEQFSKAFSTNAGGNVGGKISTSIGGSLPTTGTATFIPNVIRLTKDTGVINKLNYKTKSPTKNFFIGDTITGDSSGATAIIGDIDITGTTTGVLTIKQITGTFVDNEFIDATTDGNNVARSDGTQYTQTGRGHLNAGSASIIVEGVDMPYEIHFIDNAKNNGQLVLLRAQDGQTITLRRAITTDANTGNLDLDSSFNIVENAIVILQYQGSSNVTSDGGWVPVISQVVSGTSGGTGTSFPILYPKEVIGTTSGVINLSLNQSDGHYKQITLTGDASLTFGNLPPSVNGFKFYLLTIQDGTGGHVYTGLPASVVNSGTLLGQLQTGAGAQTIWSFVTADGGTTWHAQVINPQSGADASQWSLFKAITNVNMDTWDIYNLDKLRFFGFGGFSFPTDATIQGISTSPVGLQFNVPLDQKYTWYIAGFPRLTMDLFNLDMHDFNITNLKNLFFSDSGSFTANILSDFTIAELGHYVAGPGAHYAYYVDNGPNANWEMRLNLNKSNVNLDMVTNDIINLDQAQFNPNGGFVPVINHSERRISGGNSGININVPHLKTVKLWFENAGLTNSDLKYEFRQDGIDMNSNNIFEVQGIFFPNGGSITDLAGLGLEFRAGVTPPFGTGNPQSMIFQVRGLAPSYTNINIFELTGLEHNTTNAGGMKMFTDFNLQTHDLTNVDRLHFNSNNGIVGGGQYAIAGSTDANRLDFNVPFFKSFSFREDNTEFMNLKEGLLKMNFVFTDPRIQAHQFELVTHTLGAGSILDGNIRLVNNGGSLDIMVGTGGVVKNLTNAGGTSFIGFTADDDLNMGTFNIFNVDVLRYAIDSGVIGFGEYGSAVDSTNTKLKWSVPSGKFYEWQVNLDRIATLSPSQFYLRSNVVGLHPSIITDGSFRFGTSHTSGTSGMLNGESRLVNNAGSLDVIFRTGNTDVNLTTLSAGGGDNLGNHIMTQALNNSNFAHTNFLGWTAGVGQGFQVTGTGSRWDLPAGDIFDFFVGGLPKFTVSAVGSALSGGNLNMSNNRIINVLDPINPQDVATRAYVLANGGSVDVSASYIWTGNHNFHGALLTVGDSSSDTITINSRINSNLDPISDNAFTVGTAGRRWQSLFIAGNSNLNTATFTGVVTHFSTINMSGFKITNLGTPTLPADAVTKAYVDALGGVSLSANNTWTGTQTFNQIVVADPNPVFFANSIALTAIVGTAMNLSSAQTITGGKTFNGLVDVNGAFSANGSINFSGSGRPSSGGFVSSGATLVQLINAHNTMRAGLVSLGLLSP